MVGDKCILVNQKRISVDNIILYQNYFSKEFIFPFFEKILFLHL